MKSLWTVCMGDSVESLKRVGESLSFAKGHTVNVWSSPHVVMDNLSLLKTKQMDVIIYVWLLELFYWTFWYKPVLKAQISDSPGRNLAWKIADLPFCKPFHPVIWEMYIWSNPLYIEPDTWIKQDIYWKGFDDSWGICFECVKCRIVDPSLCLLRYCGHKASQHGRTDRGDHSGWVSP